VAGERRGDRVFLATYAASGSNLYEPHACRSPRALDRIGQLYKIETAIRGQSADERRAQRQQYAVPLLTALHAWMIVGVSEGR